MFYSFAGQRKRHNVGRFRSSMQLQDQTIRWSEEVKTIRAMCEKRRCSSHTDWCRAIIRKSVLSQSLSVPKTIFSDSKTVYVSAFCLIFRGELWRPPPWTWIKIIEEALGNLKWVLLSSFSDHSVYTYTC